MLLYRRVVCCVGVLTAFHRQRTIRRGLAQGSLLTFLALCRTHAGAVSDFAGKVRVFFVSAATKQLGLILCFPQPIPAVDEEPVVVNAPPAFVLVLARACQLVAHRYFSAITKNTVAMYPLPSDKCVSVSSCCFCFARSKSGKP